MERFRALTERSSGASPVRPVSGLILDRSSGAVVVVPGEVLHSSLSILTSAITLTGFIAGVPSWMDPLAMAGAGSADPLLIIMAGLAARTPAVLPSSPRTF